MRAIVLNSYGGPEVLELADVPAPEPGPDEVLVDVVATALNRADLLQRMGLYPGPPMEHEIPGLEFSGHVARVGQRVRSVEPGQPVMGIVAGGSYAEQLVTHERMLLPVPEGVALDDAAALPEVFLTAWDALVVQGGFTSGRTALVHGGASGVGTAAIQLVKALGGMIIVTASTRKVEPCRVLGADLAIDYTAEDFVPAVREFTHGEGVDTVLDVIGGEYVDRNLDCLRTGGRIIQVGVMGGAAAEVNVGKLLMKRATITGTTLRSRPIEQKITLSQRFAREILPLIARDDLRPVIDGRYPLEEIAAAHEHMAANANIGKIVIDVSDG
jgi:putative PIG3 family NAD(P)H quinone oxidoreductase